MGEDCLWKVREGLSSGLGDSEIYDDDLIYDVGIKMMSMMSMMYIYLDQETKMIPRSYVSNPQPYI